MTFNVLNIHYMNINGHFRAIIFDVDGTLFDTLPSLSAAANGVLLQAGLHEVSTSLLRLALNQGLRPLFLKAIALQVHSVEPEWASELETRYLDRYMQQWLVTAPLYAHVKQILSDLKSRGVKLGICTNRDRLSTEVLLVQAGIPGTFDVIVGLGDAARPKPAADPLLLALDRLGVAAHEALFVGDSYMDASCAQLSNVRFAAHLGGYAGQASDLLPQVLKFSGYEVFAPWVLSRLSNPEDSFHV